MMPVTVHGWGRRETAGSTAITSKGHGKPLHDLKHKCECDYQDPWDCMVVETERNQQAAAMAGHMQGRINARASSGGRNDKHVR